MNTIPINEIFANLTTYPGALVYHAIILFPLLLALLQIEKAYANLPIKRFKFIRIGFWLMIGLQGLLLAVSIPAWLGNPFFVSLYPVAFRLLSLLSFLSLLWVNFNDQPSTWKHITASAIAFGFIVLAVVSFIFWQQTSSIAFNASWMHLTWLLVFSLLCLSAFVLLHNEKTNLKTYVVLVIAFTLAGLLKQIIFANAGDLPAMFMASQLFVYLLMPELTCKLINSGYLEHRLELSQKNDFSDNRKIDITPRLASSMLDVALQHSYKKIQNAVSHTISLFMMADICAIVHLDSESKQLHIESAYDLIREDYLKDFSLTEAQAPMLYQSLQDEKCIQINKKEHPVDIQSLFQAIGYNQLGDPVIYPIKYNGKTATCAFLFLNPFTKRLWDQEAFDKLNAVSPTLARILDNAIEVDARNQALDDLRVSLNQSTRENQKLSKQQERTQQLLSELRTEFNNSKSSHLAEVQMWIERQKDLEDKIEALNTQINQSATEVQEAKNLKSQNQELITKLDTANAQNVKLTNALSQAKVMIEGILNPPGTQDSSERSSQNQPKEINEKSKIKAEKAKSENKYYPKKQSKSIIDEFTKAYLDKNIDLVVDLNNCPEDISVNKDVFEKILVGLLSNALLASPNGSEVQLTLNLDQVEGKDVLIIEATDQGGGLSLQEQESFFAYIDRFGQPVPGGVGDIQALREVLRAVQKLDGNIWIKSDVNKPTVFRAAIPVQIPENNFVEKEDLPE